MHSIFKITSHPTIDFAAEELKKYLRMMMPRAGEIAISYAPDAADSFRIGLMTDFGLDTSDADDIQLDDIIYVAADEKGGIIAGSNPVATLIAVYRYLRFCGCRWLFPGVDGERIPMIEALPEVNYRKLADHRYRGQCNEGAELQTDMLETIDFTPKIGMNTYMLEFDIPYYYYNTYYNHNNSTCREPEPVTYDTILQWKRQCEAEIQKRGLHFHDMGHGWTAEPFGLDSKDGWNPISMDSIPEETKELLAMLDGERKVRKNAPLLSNVCMSNPKTRRIMANYIADYAEKQNNVDFLHIWLADESNGHCECPECQKKITSDWYVMLLNDIDNELTRRNLDTHLVFIAYLDTFWAPLEEKLNNNKRFTMLYAPITRTYFETYAEKPDMSKLQPYIRNNIRKPRGMSECLAYLHDWKNKMWSGDCFCYEYHFLGMQYRDIFNVYLPNLIYRDICALKSQGLNGIIEDGSQRSYFPTGFQFYVYGETLYDSSRSYEELREDYFSHAYGDNWRAVIEYLETLSGILNDYLFGRASTDPEKGNFYNPGMLPQLETARKLTEDFRTVIEANKKQYFRASSVAWRLLAIHNDLVLDYLDLATCKCTGNDEEAIRCVDRMKQKMSEREIYIERYFDYYMFSNSIEGFTEGKRQK